MMAITESLPVGKEVVTTAAGKIATVDATAFAATFAAAEKAVGVAGAGKHVVPVAAPGLPAKGQQDLGGWNAGQGLDGSGEGALQGAGHAGDVRADDGSEMVDGGGAVSSLIGSQAIVESAGSAAAGTGAKGLEDAPVGAGMQAAVWTAAGASAREDRAAAVAPGSNSAASAGAVKLPGTSHSETARASVPRQHETPLHVPGVEALSTATVLVSTTGAVLSKESDAGAAANGEIARPVAGVAQAQAPSIVPALQPAASSAGADLAGTARVVAAANTVTTTMAEKTTGGTTGHRAEKGGPVSAAEKAAVVTESSRKAEAPVKSAGSVPAVMGFSGVEPGKALPEASAQQTAPTAAASPALPADHSALKRVTVEAASDSGSEAPGALLNGKASGTAAVALASRAGMQRAESLRAEVGSGAAVHDGATGTTATSAKRGSTLEQKTGDEIAQLGRPTVTAGTEDGSSALPLVVGVTAAPPEVTTGSKEDAAHVAGVQGVGAQVVAAKGLGSAAPAKEKDANNATANVQRSTAEAHGARAAVSEPVAATTTSTPAGETLVAGKNSSTHEGGSVAAVAGAAGTPWLSNAHSAPATGWNGSVAGAVAPARSETLGAPSATPASGMARAEDAGQAAGLGAGLSSGLAESGQGHTTLQATPTVLEVGVPGGTHGWLKIRAEVGEGGAVQASVSSATEAGQETLRKELPAMSAYLQSEHVPVVLQVAHGVTTMANGTAGSGLAPADALTAGMNFGSGGGGHAGAPSEQSRSDAASFAGVATGSADAGDSGSRGQQGSDGLVASGPADGRSRVVADAEVDWASPRGYGGVSLGSGGNWVNVIA